MKSISVHGIDEELEKNIVERAKKEGKSVNKVVKEILGESLGISKCPPDNRAQFEDLCGIWTEDEVREFEKATADLAAVDSKDWL